MAASDVNTAMSAAVVAIEAENWATALSKLRVAKAYLVALPDSRHEPTELRWNREAIDTLIKDVKQEASAAAMAASPFALGGIKINYVEPTD